MLWELSSISNFFVATKGGNLPGYAMLASMVPQLNLSVVMAINTDANDFAWMHDIQPILLPALNETLVSRQEYPIAEPGPRSADVVGKYVMKLATS